VLEEVEQGGLGPMEVIDDDDQRATTSQRLEQPPDRPRDLLA
jgi:hypothetical protein